MQFNADPDIFTQNNIRTNKQRVINVDIHYIQHFTPIGKLNTATSYSFMYRDQLSCVFDSGLNKNISDLEWILSELESACDNPEWITIPLRLLAGYMMMTTVLAVIYHYRYDMKIIWYRYIQQQHNHVQVRLTAFRDDHIVVLANGLEKFL